MDGEELDSAIPEGYEVVFRKAIVDSSGAVVRAQDFGLEYFLVLMPASQVPDTDPSKWSV